ncbi:MAG TPA: response regulator [Candidatus Eisenbacteria bacterium]|nr:response regulator [Candidatus Eisenbacteria bacterium]
MTIPSVTAEPKHPGRERTLSGIRVILVDDEADGRSLLAEILGMHGAEVRTCESADEARAALLAERPHLIISDIGMPRESGLDLMRSIRAMEGVKAVPAIALTGYDQDSLRVEALSAGYDRHVAKPVDPLELVLLARTLLASRRAFPTDGSISAI